MGLSNELARLATYKSWPRDSTIKPLTLAKLGFSYTGRGDEVECFQCKIRISGWKEGDNPQLKHRQMAPHCQLLNGNHPDNVPLDRNASVPEQVAGTVRGQTAIDGANNFDSILQPQEGPELIFHNALSRAKRNEVYFNNNGPAIDQPALRPETIAVQRAAPEQNPADGDHFDPAEIEDRMDLPTVRIILDMGYPRDQVRAVIETRLSTTGDDFPNAESILEAFFQRYGD